MGASSSTNISADVFTNIQENILKSTTEIMNNIAQNIEQVAVNNQEINISGLRTCGGDINVSDIGNRYDSTVNANAFASQAMSANIVNQVVNSTKLALEKEQEAITGGTNPFFVPIGLSVATNLDFTNRYDEQRLNQELNTKIGNYTSQQMQQDIRNFQGINFTNFDTCYGTPGPGRAGNINIRNIENASNVTAVAAALTEQAMDVVQEAYQVNTSEADIKKSQAAAAGTLTAGALILIAIIVVVVVLLKKKKSEDKTKQLENAQNACNTYVAGGGQPDAGPCAALSNLTQSSTQTLTNAVSSIATNPQFLQAAQQFAGAAM